MSTRQPATDITQYRRRKKRAGNFRWALMIIFFLACATGGYFFALSPFFAVEKIQVTGNATLDANRLRQLAGVEPGCNIFAVDVKQVRRWLAIEPLVETVRVERRLPRTISITVSERQPVAVLATGQAFVQVDNTGLVLRRMRELDTLLLPILSGVSGFPAGVLPGSRIDGEDMQVALAVLNALPEGANTAVTEIDVTDSQKIRVYTMGDVEVRIGGATDVAEKYVWAAGIINNEQLSGRATDIQYIDISSIEKPVVMHYR